MLEQEESEGETERRGWAQSPARPQKTTADSLQEARRGLSGALQPLVVLTHTSHFSPQIQVAAVSPQLSHTFSSSVLRQGLRCPVGGWKE